MDGKRIKLKGEKYDPWDAFKGRFEHRTPSTVDVVQAHERARDLVKDAAAKLVDLLEDGRYKRLTITSLEEALMWANKAIALSQNEHLRRAETPEPGDSGWNRTGRTRCPHCGIHAYFALDEGRFMHVCSLCERPYVVTT